MILDVVSLENQRLMSFRLFWLLSVQVLGMGDGGCPASVSRVPPWVRTLDKRHFVGDPVSDVSSPCQGKALFFP